MYLSYLIATGLTTGAIYALIALGIVIVYRATNLVNFAHGEMFMIAGFLAWTAHVTFALSYLPSLVVSVVATFIIGIAMYLLAYKPLMRHRDLNPILLVMIGLSFVLRGVARDDGFEDVGVADFFDAAHGLFCFEAIDGGLDSGVGGAVGFREGFLDFADGDFAVVPEGLHDLEF